MRLFFRDAQFGEPLQYFVSLDFQLPRQLVYSNLLHRESYLQLTRGDATTRHYYFAAHSPHPQLRHDCEENPRPLSYQNVPRSPDPRRAPFPPVPNPVPRALRRALPQALRRFWGRPAPRRPRQLPPRAPPAFRRVRRVRNRRKLRPPPHSLRNPPARTPRNRLPCRDPQTGCNRPLR